MSSQILSDAYHLSFAAYGDLPPNVWNVPQGYSQVNPPYNDLTAIDGAKTGLQFTMHKDATGHIVVAFTGTEAESGPDWLANLQYGWNQFSQNKDVILSALQDAIDNNGGVPVTSITFTGHSLGGMVAQYMAYAYEKEVVQNPESEEEQVVDVNLVTIDSPGVLGHMEDMLGTGYDANVISGFDYVANDRGSHSLFAQLGTEHVGGNVHALNLSADVRYDPIGSHAMEGFYNALNVVGAARTPSADTFISLEDETLELLADRTSNYNNQNLSEVKLKAASIAIIAEAVELSRKNNNDDFDEITGIFYRALFAKYKPQFDSYEALGLDDTSLWQSYVDELNELNELIGLASYADYLSDSLYDWVDNGVVSLAVNQFSQGLMQALKLAATPQWPFSLDIRNIDTEDLDAEAVDYAGHVLENNPLQPADVADLPDYLEGGVGVEGAFGTWFTPLFGWWDPLAIDLDNSGDIEELPANSVYFDIDNDGMKEAASWISGADGWLARDLNDNGQIDNIGELFGNMDTDGFAELATLDTNADGKIDQNDTAYADLLVWQDVNSDGISQSNELFSVADDLFIQEMPTAPATGHENVVEAAIGQLHIEDIFLNIDNRNATPVLDENTYIDFDVLALPELRGYGRVSNLSLRMSADETLKTAVSDLTSQSLTDVFGDFLDFRDDFNTVLYKWGGVNDIAVDSRGSNVDDARKLELLEEFDDREFLQFRNVNTSSNPQTLTGEGIMRAYDVFERAVFARFLLQMGGDEFFENDVFFNRFTDEIASSGTLTLNATLLNDLGTEGASAADATAFWKNIAFVLDNMIDGGLASLSGTETAKLDTAIAISDNTLDWDDIETSYLADFPPAPIAGTAIDETFHGTALSDEIDGSGGIDLIYGYEGSDILSGGEGNDQIYGGAGADHLIGGEGNDTLDGGEGLGNLLEGGNGDDTYIIHLGDNDTIVDTGGDDFVQFSSTIDTNFTNANIVAFRRYFDADGTTGNDLVIPVYHSNGISEVFVQNYFGGNQTNGAIEIIDFGNVINGSLAYNDQDQSYSGRKVLITYGSDSDDNIVSAVYDTGSYAAGTGEYIEAGDGDDTIVIQADVTYSEIHVLGEEGDDTFIINGDDVGYSFTSGIREYNVEGGNGDDTFFLESGTGYVQGDEGSDTYIYTSGNQRIYEGNHTAGTDRIIIDNEQASFSELLWSSSGQGRFYFEYNWAQDFLVLPSDSSFEEFIINDDLVINLNTHHPDSWYYGTNSADTITDDIASGRGGDDVMTGTSGDDILGGGEDNDILYGAGSGSDWLDGGRGDDTLKYELRSDLGVDTSKSVAIGGAGTDTLALYMTAAQYADSDIFAELKAAQNYFYFHQDTADLNGYRYEFSEFGLDARDIETFEVYVDDVLTDIGAVVNADPVAQDDDFDIYEDTVLTGNLLSDNGNGVDYDINQTEISVTATSFTTANGGDVVINADGSFSYTPDAGYIGQDTFTYTVNDAYSGSDTGTVIIDVAALPNRAPVAVDDEIHLSDENSYSGNVLQDNGHNGYGVDFDLDRDSLTVTAGTIVTSEGGSVVMQADGDFVYTGPSAYVSTDTFTYEISDGNGGTDTGTAYLTVAEVLNSDPVAINESFIVEEDENLSGNLLQDNGRGADYDLDGDVITVTSGTFSTTNGSITVSANGDFTYTPDTNYTGVDTYQYTVSDGNGGTDTATASFSVTDSIIYGTSGYDNPLNGTNDADIIYGLGHTDWMYGFDGDDIMYGGSDTYDYLFGGNGNDRMYGEGGQTDRFWGGAGNDYMDGGDGTSDDLRYDDDPAGVIVDMIAGTAVDGWGGQDTFVNMESTFGSLFDDFIRVDGTSDIIYGNEGEDTLVAGWGAAELWGAEDADTFLFDSTSITGSTSRLMDFSLSDGDMIDLRSVLDFDSQTDNVTDFVKITTSGSNSILEIDVDGTDTGNSFQQIAVIEGVTGLTDESALVSSGHLLVDNNAIPVAQDDVFVGTEDQNITGNVLLDNGNGADMDFDNDTLSVKSGTYQMTYGTLTLASSGAFTYTPMENFYGVDRFTYWLMDEHGSIDFGSIDFIVENIEESPVAEDDSFTGEENNDISGNLFADNLSGTDYDPDGDIITVSAGTFSTTNGSITVSANGDFTYTPDTNYTGVDTFQYTVSDGNGGTDTATASFSVTDSVIYGTSGQDNPLNGTSDADIMYGLGHADFIYGYGGDDIIYGGDDTGYHDRLYGGDGNDRLYGGNGYSDRFWGGAGNDYMDGGDGTSDDLRYDDDPAGVIVDMIAGTAVDGWGGQDTFVNMESTFGSLFDDFIRVDGTSDIIYGNEGEDTLVAGWGAAELWGAEDADTFLFDSTSITGSDTRIMDFNTSEGDAIHLEDVLDYDPLSDALTDFVKITTSGSNSILEIDVDGTDTGSVFQQIAVIEGVTGLTDEDALVSAGNLVVT